MSAHRDPAPGSASVVKGWIATALPIPMAAYVQSAPELDLVRMTLTATLALTLTGLFLVAALERHSQWRAAAERARAARSRPGPSPGALETVRLPLGPHSRP